MSYTSVGAFFASITDKTEWVKKDGVDACWDHTINKYVDGSYCGAKSGAAAPASEGFFGKLLSGLTTGVGIYGQTQQNKAIADLARAQAAASGGGGGMPSWVVPVAVIGGVGLLAVVLLKKKSP